MTAPVQTSWRIYRRVFEEARPYRLHIAGVLLLSLLSTPLALLVPLPLKLAVDNVLGAQPLPPALAAVLPNAATRSDGALLALVAGLVVSVAFLTQLQGVASQLLRTYTGQRLVLDFRSRLFRHAQRLSLSYHDAMGAADSTYRIQYDASAVKQIAIDGVIPFVSSIVKLIVMIVVTARINAQLALVALVVCPVLFAVLRLYSIRLRGGWRQLRTLDSSVMSLVQEVLGGVRVVKAFGQEDREQARFVREADKKVQVRTRLALLEGSLGLLIGLVVATGTAAVLFVGVRQVQMGALTLGSLLLVMSYLAQLYGPLEKVSQKMGDVQSALVGAERAFALRDEAPDVPERPHARLLARAAGAVAFEGVSFAYVGDPILRDVTFKIAPGTRLGIAGTTGAGKTTLVNLLTRFYDPTAGRILLDGVDLRDYQLAGVREQFAIVLQEPVLFSASIAENIAYARPEAGHEAIVAAARAAHVDAFVASLPDGYDTLVGERGMRLSGGERQRISLARAFLKDAPILILDEPTSAVDTGTEAAIMAAMAELMHGRTAIMIAHRLSTLEQCDARIVLEAGRVVEMRLHVA